MKLTKRDKILLQVLIIVLIVVVFGSFIILPQWNKLGVVKDELLEKEQTQQEIELAITGIPAQEKRIEANQEEYDQVMEKFYPIMESHETERMITQVILGQGLETRDFEITTKPELSSLLPYFASAQALEMGITEENQADSGSAEEPTQNIVYSYQTEITIIGQRENMKNLIDLIYQDYPSIRIVHYEISSEKALNMATQTSIDISQMTLGLEIYMCTKE